MRLNKIPLKTILFILAPVWALVLIFFPQIMDPSKPEIAYMAAIAIWMAVWWMTEVIPLGVTALIPVAFFPLLGIMDGKAVAETYFNHLIFLFMGGFIIALAMEKWHLHKRIALRLLLWIGISPSRILLGFMLATAFLSMWISNTATVMMMIPILLSIFYKLEEMSGGPDVQSIEKGLLLGVAYAASIGGIATLIGTPPNLAFVRILKISFPQAPEISFVQWVYFAFPLSMLLLLIAYLYLYTTYFKKKKLILSDSEKIIRREYTSLGPMKYEEKWVFSLFVLLALLWLFKQPLHIGSFKMPGWVEIFSHPRWIKDGNIAILVSILLFIIPAKNSSRSHFLMDWKSAERIPWNIILLFGGGFALAAGFKTSGLSHFIGMKLTALQTLHPVIILLVVVTTLTFLTELTSNTASAQTFLPILASLSAAIHINPLFLMIPATIAASFAFMLPVATPPNAIVFGTNKLKISDMAKTGFWMNLIGILVLTLVSYFYLQYVFDISMSTLPAWM